MPSVPDNYTPLEIAHGSMPPELVALGQSLCEHIKEHFKMYGDGAKINVTVDFARHIDCDMHIELADTSYVELKLDHEGNWHLIGAGAGRIFA